MGSFLSAEVAEAARKEFTPQNQKSLIQDRIRWRDRGTFWKKMKMKKMKKMKMKKKMMLEPDFVDKNETAHAAFLRQYVAPSEPDRANRGGNDERKPHHDRS
jgi:hypothetical protein